MDLLARRALILGFAAILAGCGSDATPAASPSSDVASPTPTASVAAAPSASRQASPAPSSNPGANGVPGWTATGSMVEARQALTATRLRDGRVLAAGGATESSALASVELYDPASGSWTATGPMAHARVGHTATLLLDGRVLVAGGVGDELGGSPSSGALASAELYDPASGSWSATGAMTEARRSHTATLLPDGEVLVVGGASTLGSGAGGALASAELYDPATGTWTATGAMSEARNHHSATLLRDGRVLAAGGMGRLGLTGEVAVAELYDPRSGSWAATGAMIEPRNYHAAALLADGKVLAAGGAGRFPGGAGDLASAELYDPASGSWTLTGTMVKAGSCTAAQLADGRVLVVGGYAQLYDPVRGAWIMTGDMVELRGARSVASLLDGRVLVAGGYGGGPVAAAELYDTGAGN